MLEDTRQTSLCKPVSKTILLGCENGSFPSLFDCHLAISQSSTACYTSFKRGDSGLPADVKIRTIFQLIGIVWSYFLRISRYQCIYICICIQIRIQIVSKYLVSFPSLLGALRSGGGIRKRNQSTLSMVYKGWPIRDDQLSWLKKLGMKTIKIVKKEGKTIKIVKN